MAPTRVVGAVCDLAIALVGAISVPIYPSVTPEQAAYIVRDSGCGVAIVSGPTKARRLRAAAPGLHAVIVLDDPTADDLGLDRLQAEGEASLAELRPRLAALAAALDHTNPFTLRLHVRHNRRAQGGGADPSQPGLRGMGDQERDRGRPLG